MYYLYNLTAARSAHALHGGVLLDYGEMYVVCRFRDAVELRADEFPAPVDLAAYWAVMAESGYDESEPRVRRVRVALGRPEAILIG